MKHNAFNLLLSFFVVGFSFFSSTHTEAQDLDTNSTKNRIEHKETIYRDLFSSITITSTGISKDGVIIDAVVGSGMNGFSLGMSWEQTSSNVKKISDTHWITSVTGTYTYFIGLKGVGTYYSKTITITDDLIL